MRRRFRIDWEKAPIAAPSFLGGRVLRDFPLKEIAEYIDWSPFFMAWELSGKYPQILSDANVGAEAREAPGRRPGLLQRIIGGAGCSQAHAVYGFYPANSEGDDMIVFTDETRSQERARFPMLRQQWEREGQTSFRSLADYLAPVESGRADYLGAFAVTAGAGAEELAAKFEADHDDYNGIMTKALADRLAEAFAELLHAARPPRLGLRPRRTSHQGRSDSREISRHPSGGGLPVVPRPHGEGDAVAAAGRGGEDGNPADGELRDDAGGVGERAVFRAPGGDVLRGGPGDARPGGGLRPAEEDAAGGGGTVAGAEFGV